MDQAVILAAGQAERLLPLTESRPKAMLLVGGKPLVQHTVEALVARGVTDIVVVVGHKAEKIQAFLQDGSPFGARVRYALQGSPSGTTDAMRSARPLLEPGRDVWVVSGAVFVTPEDLAPLAKARGDALVVAPAGDPHDQPVPVLKGGRLAGIRWETPQVGATRVVTGLLRMTWDTLTALDLDRGEGEGATSRAPAEAEDALGSRAAGGADVEVLGVDGPWHRIIQPWDVLRLNEHVLDRLTSGDGKAATKPRRTTKGPRIEGIVRVGDNTHIAPSATLIGPVAIGDGCTVGEYTVIGPYVSIRNNSVVGAHCEIRHSILNNNVLLDSRALVRGSILDDGADVGPLFVTHERRTARGPVGCIVGRDARIGAGVRAAGASIVPPEDEVAPGTAVDAHGMRSGMAPKGRGTDVGAP